MNRLTLPRRLLVVAALMFWQGGFTFYAAVVVPVGQRLFGDEVQAQTTRIVTTHLNQSAAVGLAVFALDLLTATDPSWRRLTGRWLLWAGVLLTLGLLVWLHPRLEGFMDEDSFNRRVFRPYHRLYLWISTFQWAFAVAFVWLTLKAWQAEDRRQLVNKEGPPVGSGEPGVPVEKG